MDIKLEELCAYQLGELVNDKKIKPTDIVTYFKKIIENIIYLKYNTIYNNPIKKYNLLKNIIF